MVRAGRGGRFFDSFESDNFVAIGWNDLGCLEQYTDKDSIRESYIKIYGNDKPSKTANGIAIVKKFKDEIQKGDLVISYSPRKRQYQLGKDLGEYLYKDNAKDEYAHRRKVIWLGTVSRDLLSQKSRNTLSSVLTLFSLNKDVVKELTKILEEKC